MDITHKKPAGLPGLCRTHGVVEQHAVAVEISST